ncbi:hypothetical protein ACFQV5_13680 [Paenibacillus sp. GCM10028914]
MQSGGPLFLSETLRVRIVPTIAVVPKFLEIVLSKEEIWGQHMLPK